MNEILKQFGKFLRYYVCGFVFILTVFYPSGWYPAIKDLRLGEYLLIPLIPGTIVYTIHRNFVNVFIEWIRRYMQDEKEWLITEGEWKGMIFRWGDGKDTQLNNIKNWGDHVQMLYSTGLSVLSAGTLTPIFVPPVKEYKFSLVITLVCCSFYIVGFFADIRKQTAETKLMKSYQNW
jgi:hypothetical protein